MANIILSIIIGQLRHVATAAGGALVTSGIHLVAGLPVVHDTLAVIAGGALLAVGGVSSAMQKIKTQSGAIYKTND